MSRVHHITGYYLALCLTTLQLTSAAATAQEDPVKEVVAGIVEARRAINQGHVRLQSAMSKRIDGELRPYSRTVYECYFRGAELHMDRRIFRISSDGVEGEILREVNIVNASQQVISLDSPPGGQKVLPVVMHKEAGRQYDQAKHRVWDVRFLGLAHTPFPAQHQESWDTIILGVTATKRNYDESAHLLTIVHPSGVHTMLLDGSQQNLPIRHESRENDGSMTVVEVQNRDWSHHKESPAWFPKQVRYSQVDPAGVMTLLNECQVLDADFTTPLSDDLFDLDCLNLEAGRQVKQVTGESDSVRSVWDGKALTAGSVPVTLAPIAVPANGHVGRRNILLLINAVCLSLLGLAALIWKRRKPAS